MKKTLLIFFIILTTLAPLLAFSGSTSADSVTIKRNKATAISIAEHAPVVVPANTVLSKKTLLPLPDSTTISPVPNDQLLVSQSASSQSLVTSHQSTNDQLTNQPIPNDYPTNYHSSTFFPEGLIPSSDPIDSAQYYIAKAQAVIQEVREFRKFVGYLDGESLLSLPVGIHKEIGGLDYDIAIASIKLKPQYAELEVFMTFEMPQNGKVLTFRGKGIKFTKEGGIVGDATLELVADYAINLQGEKAQIILKSGTAVNFDCSGFLEMALNADIKFARSMLIPEGPTGDTLSGNVIASFRSTIKNWNDLVVEVNLPPFQVATLKGVGFNVRSAVFDFSDYRNAPNVRFPEGYQSPAILAGLPNLWRGFYLRELSVSLPAEFNKSGTSERTQFLAQDVLIDDMGFSGLLTATNLIDQSNGDMNGWAYSLDSLQIDLMANSIRSGSFSGGIVIPISGEQRPFNYTALIQPGSNYIFNVAAPDSLQFDIFKTSKLELYPNSFVEIAVVDGKFMPKANLHGKMNIQAQLGSDEKKKGVELADITFENLQLQSVKPYIQVGNFSFGSEAAQQAMANFPISINNIGMKNISDTEVGLEFDLLLNLTGSDGGSFAADAGLTIVGELPAGEKIQKWKYKEVQVRNIAIDIDGGAYKFQGQLTFFKNDAMYGEGFNGQVQAEFKPGIKVQATAIFGNMDGFRYWYADALGSFSSGIPIFTGVGIYGFGGGAYYRMAMDTEGVGSALGETVSGVVYIPKKTAGLGLKATVEIASHPKPDAFNGDMTFEVAFNRGGGMRYISFKGNGYIATPAMDGTLAKMKEKTQKLAGVVAKAEKAMGNVPGGAMLAQTAEKDQSVTQIYGQIGEAAGKKGQISANVFISYDFNNNVLHGNFEAYVNVAGGLIKGVGEGGRAGWAVLHFAPDEWYVYAGTPEDRIGMSMGVGPIRAQTTSYLMVGTSIPGSPPPPDNVSKILGGMDLDYMRDENALGTGGGFAFGSAFSVDTGDLTFLMFYASLSAGAGFDIMLKDYGSMQCAGSSGPVGINGWYANGQAYAYFEGNIGIKVKLFGKNKKVDIIDLGAAAVMQAKLPNPFWMRGVVGGHFKVLGGLVKGDCRFEVTLGEECELQGGSALEGVQVIAEVTPGEGEKDVNVFNNPQAVFNMPVDEIFEMVDVDEQKKTFRIKLDEFKVMSGTTEIKGDLNWNANHDVVALDSYDIFPSEKKMSVKVKVSFEERRSGNWTPVIVDGKKYTEEKTVNFTSGIAPDHIPQENVQYSYPVVNQLNFYKDEYNKGYIKLEKGQPELFTIGAEWNQKARFTAVTGEEIDLDYSYSNGNKEVSFNIPPELSTDKIYKFELVNVPAQQAKAIDRNVKEQTNKVAVGDQTLDTEIRTRTAEGSIAQLQEKQVFGMNFRSSKYGTLDSKINATDRSQTGRWPIRSGVHELINSFKGNEFFDEVELHGGDNYSPMIQFNAVLTNNDYYNKYMLPIIYANYPIHNKFTINWRTASEMGVPPTKAIFIRQYPVTNLRLTESDIASGRTITPPNLSAAIIYNLSNYYQRDLSNLQSDVANYYAESGNTNERIQLLLTSPFPRISGGSYEYRVQYVLPGKNIITSEKLYQMINPLY